MFLAKKHLPFCVSGLLLFFRGIPIYKGTLEKIRHAREAANRIQVL